MSHHRCETCADTVPIDKTVMFVFTLNGVTLKPRMCRPCGDYWMSKAIVVLKLRDDE